MLVCPSCGQENPAGFRFCGACATPLTAAAPSPREERKVVSVLFCDLVGSTSRAERLDPEDVRVLLSRYHARVRRELERFGGTVEKFIGDAVVALFGAPVAHEDDPERAVRAALAIREWVADEPDLHVRVAVNTGEALVALGARPESGEGMASGDVVNTAARLQSAAPVDGILVGEQTYRATERAIEYRSSEPVRAKGKSEPVPAWEAVQARSRLGVDVAQPPAAPLIGREREVDLLVDALERACEERAPQLLTIVGVPGIGKSRLLTELVRAIEQGDRLITWRQGRSLPYGEGVSFWAVGEMVKAQAGILDTDQPADAARKLGEAVERLLADRAEARWVEGHLRPLAGLGSAEAAADRRGEAFAAWRRFFEALADLRPLVLVFEDLHWADDGLLDFVDELAERLTDAPVLVVASARPELLARRPAWGGGKANATTLSLVPLKESETAQLVHVLLQRSVLPAETQALLLERAGGNPLYAEEFVRMATERGHDRLELPESVQGIIASRLDALAPEDKELLQNAAVIGKVFWTGALGGDRFEVEERLHGLERRELVRRERRTSVDGEDEWAFRHVLVRDVAYGTLPRAARAERHRRAAAWIESLGRPDDHADLLAHHYRSALELARAAGVEIGVSASTAAAALQRAGDRAFALNAFPSAIRFYDDALALGIPDESRPRLLLRLGAALNLTADDRRTAILEEAREAQLVAGDVEGAAEAGIALADALWDAGEVDRSDATIAEAWELVRDRGASPAAARALDAMARHANVTGRREEAIRVGGEAVRMAELVGMPALVASALASIGSSRSRDDFDAGVADLERAAEVALSANSPEAARILHNLGVALFLQEGVGRAYDLWVRARDVGERLGNVTNARFTSVILISAHYQRGDWDEALRAADVFVAGGQHYARYMAQRTRALIVLARGDDVGAEAAATRAVELARELGHAQALTPSLTALLHVYVELGRLDHARTVAQEMLDPAIGAAGDASVLLATCAERFALVDEVRAMLGSVPATMWTRAATAILAGDLARAADLLDASGELTVAADVRLDAASRGALGQLEPALEFFRSVGASRYVAEAESLRRSASARMQTSTTSGSN
jgi:class 3 adenylate cyclase/tetratricopeptide (TPR) repeat protein